MPVILRGVPAGHDWGWYANEDQRMHLQTVDAKHDFKVWLEDQGHRAFLPEGRIPAKVLKALRETLDDSGTRKFIETRWTRLMVAKNWIDMHVALPNVTLSAYPNTPNKFVRTVDLTDWFAERYVATLRPEVVGLNEAMGSLRLGTDRPETDAHDLRLSTLLWGELPSRSA